MGKAAAQKLLQQIYYGGCTDPAGQSIAALCMALSQKDVSQIVVGPLSEYTMAFLRHLRDYFGITFNLEHHDLENEDEVGRGSSKVLMTCVGVGYSNFNKRVI